MPVTDQRLHPEVRTVLEAMEAAGGPLLESLPPAEARKLAREGLRPVAGIPEPVAGVEDLRIPGPAGEIPIRIYTPEGSGPFPALVYFHGGGWVVCDLDTHDIVCRAIARRAGAVVVAVDYRLAPEHKFPAAVEDAYAATSWVVENAANLDLDPKRIAVGGDSAGGNLSAIISLKSRDLGKPAIAAQILVYPVTNLASFDTESYREFADGYHLTTAQMEWFRDCYLARSEDALSTDASPLLADRLEGLPPALIITAECDPLRDEGEAYAKRLGEAGVAVVCKRYAGMIHPFFSMLGAIADSRKAIAQVADALRAM